MPIARDDHRDFESIRTQHRSHKEGVLARGPRTPFAHYRPLGDSADREFLRDDVGFDETPPSPPTRRDDDRPRAAMIRHKRARRPRRAGGARHDEAVPRRRDAACIPRRRAHRPRKSLARIEAHPPLFRRRHSPGLPFPKRARYPIRKIALLRNGGNGSDAAYVLGSPWQHPNARGRAPSRSAATPAASKFVRAQASSFSTGHRAPAARQEAPEENAPSRRTCSSATCTGTTSKGFLFFEPAFVAGNALPSVRRQQRLAHARRDARRPDGLPELPGAPRRHRRQDDVPRSRRGRAGGDRRRRTAGKSRSRALAATTRKAFSRSGSSTPARPLSYATDTEHYAGRSTKSSSRLARGAAVLVYDAQYTPEEYAGIAGGAPKKGWGHSTFEEGAKLAKAAGARQPRAVSS